MANKLIIENNEPTIIENILKVEKLLIEEFKKVRSDVLIEIKIEGSDHFYFDVHFNPTLLLDDTKTLMNQFRVVVEKYFNRIDDHGMTPMIGASKVEINGTKYAMLTFHYGSIDLKNSNIYKSLKNSNKFNL